MSGVTCADDNHPVIPCPNPDLDGLGVLIGFVATAYITVIIIACYYIFGYKPKLQIKQLDLTSDDGSSNDAPNPLDHFLLTWLRHKIPSRRVREGKHNLDQSLSKVSHA